MADPGLPCNSTNMLDILWQLVGVFFISNLVQCTNLYAASSNPPATWYDTTEEEMRAFIGFNILLGIHCLPCLTDYWSSECHTLLTGFLAIVLKQFANFFGAIQKERVADKLAKVRPFIQVLQQNFPKLLVAWSALSVDGAMIKFDGRLQQKQYMPKKTVK